MNKDGMPTGGLPPFEPWMQGKTAETIYFVCEASDYLDGQPMTHPHKVLMKYVYELRNGTKSLNYHLTLKEFMDSDDMRSRG